MYRSRVLPLITLAGLLGGSMTGRAQAPSTDPIARLKTVLPADVAGRVLARIAEARSHDLPGDALELRALKFAARGIAPEAIERSVSEQADRMAVAKAALQRGRGAKPADDEIDAGAETLRKGVAGEAVTALAKGAPSGRSLAVPLYVIGSLIDRGLPADQALQRVQERLQARASDSDLEELPAKSVPGEAHRPAQTGRGLAATKRPAGAGAAHAGGPPAGLPASAAAGARPGASGKGHRP